MMVHLGSAIPYKKGGAGTMMEFFNTENTGHRLYDSNGVGKLPAATETSGSGKTTTLIFTGMDYQQPILVLIEDYKPSGADCSRWKIYFGMSFCDIPITEEQQPLLEAFLKEHPLARLQF